MPPSNPAPSTPSPADRLLDAQVAYLLGEWDDDRIADTVAGLVDDVLSVAATVTLAQAIDLDALQEIALRVVRAIGSSPNLADLVGDVSDALYDNEGAHLLGDSVERDPVDALVGHVIALRRAQDRLLERVGESPLAGAVAAKFVTTIISDFVAQNRQRAEKLPGMGSLFSIGQSAASRMPGKSLLGDAAGKSAQYAMKSTRGAMRDMMRDAPLRGAAMEIWDLHAAEAVGDLRAYLTKTELRELVLIVHEIVVNAQDSQLATELVGVAVEVFYERFGSYDLAALLAEIGLDRDALVADGLRLAPRVVAAARADGSLERVVRARLAPFFASPEVAAILKRPTPQG